MFSVQTQHPIATHSLDHTSPWGTKNDNSSNPEFNRRLYELFGNLKRIHLLDLGCAGGGSVKSFIDDGHLAIGIEGSDYSKMAERAEWATIPGNLFTADITKPFTVLDGEGMPIPFDVVTAWEVIEHIHERDLPGVIDNVLTHLESDGIWIMSVSEVPSHLEAHHVCVHPQPWWEGFFSRYGLKNNPDKVAFFNAANAWVRGPNHGAPHSFHLVLERAT